MKRLSKTLSSLSRVSSWGQTPSRARMAGPCSEGSRPRMRSSPPVTGDTAAIIRIVEDFPAPFGPRKPKASPRRTSMSMPWTASTVSPPGAWNDLRRSRARIMGPSLSWGTFTDTTNHRRHRGNRDSRHGPSRRRCRRGPRGAYGFGMERRHARSGSPYEETIGFSRAVRVGSTVAVSGTAPVWPDGHVDPDPAVQARRCWEIVVAALEGLDATVAAGAPTRQNVRRADGGD